MNKTLTQLKFTFGSDAHINTLRGPVGLDMLGMVLIHEHVFCRVRPQYMNVAQEYLLQQFDVLWAQGVRTIVDLTTYVLPDQYYDLLRDHPINVVCCAGYYLKSRVPSAYHQLDASALADKLMHKVNYGIGKLHIKPGILKVASSGRKLTKFEKNAIHAVGVVQQQSKLPVVTHACRGARQQVEILLNAGAQPHKILISHMEMELKGVDPMSFEDVLQDMIWILEQGVNIFFGDFPAQNNRYKNDILRLVQQSYQQGYANQIFLSTDSYWTYRFGRIGVRGRNSDGKLSRDYNYIFKLIIPFLLQNGFSQKDISRFLTENPVRLFSPSN